MGRHRLFNAEDLSGGSTINSNSIFLAETKSRHTMAFEITDSNTSISAFTVILQGSLNGRNVTDANATWFDVATHAFTGGEITALAAMFHAVSKPLKRLRFQVSASTGHSAGDTLDGWYLDDTQ
jgi:hypothetical protein